MSPHLLPLYINLVLSQAASLASDGQPGYGHNHLLPTNAAVIALSIQHVLSLQSFSLMGRFVFRLRNGFRIKLATLINTVSFILS